MKNKYQIKWWYNWLKADYTERVKMVEKLPLLKESYNMLEWENTNLTKEDRRRLVSRNINSLFEDLEEEIYFQMLQKAKRDDLE